MTTNRKHRRGFTLIEAIVVIVIIGVLATVIGPPLYRNVFKSKAATAASNAKAIATQVKLYQIDYGALPESLSALMVKGDKGGPYLNNSDELKDPWGHEFVIRVPPQKNNDFDIVSYGADGRPGGSDDDADIVMP
jgi:general secretion pathway protein G